MAAATILVLFLTWAVYVQPKPVRLEIPSFVTKNITADGLNIFYREAGAENAENILLLHGFPSSSHQYRNLIPLLSQKYHVIAPDLPGFGFTEVPFEREYKYTFENLTLSIEAFLDVIRVTKYSAYIFDYGAPVGLRLALRRPSSVQTIISQNGNAYEEGLGAAWAPIEAYWKSGSAGDRQNVDTALLNFDATKSQYTTGTDATIAPEAYWLDYALLSRPGNHDIQLDLFYDYQNNVKLYPQFQKYFRESRVPLLAVWGKNDPFFVSAGAEAFKKDLKNAKVHLLDAGHFAVESNTEDIAELILEFLRKNGI